MATARLRARRTHFKISGVYQILCRPTGKSYVGSSRNIPVRWSRHRSALRHGKNGCWRLQLAWAKYGEAAFEFSILEECAADHLDAREQFYIDALEPALNVVRDIEVGAVRLAIAANKIRYAAITHCPHGHAYDEANTYIGKKAERICRACNAERVAAILGAQSEEEKAARLRRNRERHQLNRARNLAKMKEYVASHKAEKREYDRRRRAALQR